jgi:hypothetical protein
VSLTHICMLSIGLKMSKETSNEISKNYSTSESHNL